MQQHVLDALRYQHQKSTHQSQQKLDVQHSKRA